MSVSRAKFTAVKKPRARINNIPTPYSCGKFKYAATNATIVAFCPQTEFWGVGVATSRR